MKVKVGDIVHVRCKVTMIEHTGLEVTRVNIRGTEIWTANDTIVHVEPATLKVGDSVRRRNCKESSQATVLSVHGNHAWVSWGALDCGVIFNLDEVERA